MKLSNFVKGVFTCFLIAPLVSCNILKFMDDCTTHCRKTHTKLGNLHESESNPTKTRHTAEDIALTSCLQRCRLAEIIRPKSTIEVGNI